MSGIAPTIATLGGAVVDPWPDIVDAAGKVLGEQDAATALTDQVEADIARVGDELLGLKGKTFTFFNVVAGDGIYVLTDPDDGANQLFSQLGLVVAPKVAALGTDVEGGRLKISFEQTDLLDADLMVYLGNGSDVTSLIPGFSEFPAVQAGASVELDYADTTALNTPSPLSIPYVLEKIRPTLAAAAG
ncbi:MAG: ABC transporter substrate-binding protein [Ilumatobacteraceae bacterium]